VWQHSLGEVEASATDTRRVSSRMYQWKKFENRSTFTEVMTKNQIYYFFPSMAYVVAACWCLMLQRLAVSWHSVVVFVPGRWRLCQSQPGERLFASVRNYWHLSLAANRHIDALFYSYLTDFDFDEISF